ncbi:histone acetylation protein-domain-containing protein [Apodospora peruviana]|uniref:histone acetyltransferase n=1 Tax=Apodospora peruviana TaxID=516989 RepID=A0AAE0IH95_9PEZI|nr:histone acetylation protein-domain-containing protein [Apodospora peruviana]
MISLTPSTVKRDSKFKSSSSSSASSLNDKLASVLPRDYKFFVYHISTPPTKTEPLCSAPPGERPDKTFQEQHFLAVAINVDPQTDATPGAAKSVTTGADEAKDTETRKRQVLAFAVEIFIFTTAYQTTFFVSKADSTGFLGLLNLPKGSPSPIREVTSTFFSYLVEHRRRKNTQSVVNLFARAQAQYLFPASVENKGKHVLDDWGLVRWWCRVLNPLLESQKRELWESSKGYLIVPGLEESEMRALVPRTSTSLKNWVIGHPMERISHYTGEFDWVPPRCLIPKYPDDPKSRFRDELDEEATKWKKDMGTWKSVKTLSQFWEMMAFRQECSSGRLTGFIWLVFDPPGHKAAAEEDLPESGATTQLNTPKDSFSSLPPNGSFSSMPDTLPPSTPPRRRLDSLAKTPQTSPLKLNLGGGGGGGGSVSSTPTKFNPTEEKERKKKKLTGVIVPRDPKVKTARRSYVADEPKTTAYYHWPREGRGEKVVADADFKRIVELLLHLEFSPLAKAIASTRRWIKEAGTGAKWGQEVTGKRSVLGLGGSVNGGGGLGGSGAVTDLASLVRKKSTAPTEGAGIFTAPAGVVNVLSSNLVKKRKNSNAPEESGGIFTAPAAVVNVLSSDLVKKRKKPEEEEESFRSEAAASAQETEAPRVNVLGVKKRKKPEEEEGVSTQAAAAASVQENVPPKV